MEVSIKRFGFMLTASGISEDNAEALQQALRGIFSYSLAVDTLLDTADMFLETEFPHTDTMPSSVRWHSGSVYIEIHAVTTPIMCVYNSANMDAVIAAMTLDYYECAQITHLDMLSVNDHQLLRTAPHISRLVFIGEPSANYFENRAFNYVTLVVTTTHNILPEDNDNITIVRNRCYTSAMSNHYPVTGNKDYVTLMELSKQQNVAPWGTSLAFIKGLEAMMFINRAIIPTLTDITRLEQIIAVGKNIQNHEKFVLRTTRPALYYGPGDQPAGALNDINLLCGKYSTRPNTLVSTVYLHTSEKE